MTIKSTQILFTSCLQPATLRWDEHLPSCQRIQERIATIAKSRNIHGFETEDLQTLGVLPIDFRVATVFVKQLQQKQQEAPLIFTKDPFSLRTFFVTEPGKERPIAVFKLGEKQGAYEIAIKTLALSLGLTEYVPFSLFCTVQNLPIESTSNRKESYCCIKELWNGKDAEYKARQPENVTAVVGILQPYVRSYPSFLHDSEQVARLLLLLLATGIQEVPSSQVAQHGHTRSEASFPLSLQSFSLPYPKELLERTLSSSVIQSLKETVAKWNIAEITVTMRKLPIPFFDRAVETPAQESPLYTDEGGYLVTTTTIPHRTNYLDEEINPNMRILTKKQIVALKKRLYLIQQFIFSRDSFSLAQLTEEIYTRA